MKNDKILSVFVDESGMFKYPDPDSEFKFFGSPRDFKRNVMRKIKAKEI